jgi:hypothetical protein
MNVYDVYDPRASPSDYLAKQIKNVDYVFEL